MARKLYYKIVDNGTNKISNCEWDEILRLQHWYNSEFVWTAGRLGFKMYTVFPNTDSNDSDIGNLQAAIRRRHKELRDEGFSDNETIQQLQSEGLILAHKGGYLDDCLASGFTRVAGNEFNAYLVCEFLLKVSSIARDIFIQLYDEGSFVKSKNMQFHRGDIHLQTNDTDKIRYYRELIINHHVFSIVDPEKYDRHPNFENTVNGYNDLTVDERHSILKDWNWLGFENNYDINGDDVRGYNLNLKVNDFHIDILTA